VDSEAVWKADAVALADRISTLLTVARSAEAEIGSLLVEIESRGVMELFGYRSTARLFEHLADIPKSAAETIIKRARALTPSHTLDGTPIPAVAPATGASRPTGCPSSCHRCSWTNVENPGATTSTNHCHSRREQSKTGKARSQPATGLHPRAGSPSGRRANLSRHLKLRRLNAPGATR
jgi:hypothetical protein